MMRTFQPCHRQKLSCLIAHRPLIGPLTSSVYHHAVFKNQSMCKSAGRGTTEPNNVVEHVQNVEEILSMTAVASSLGFLVIAADLKLTHVLDRTIDLGIICLLNHDSNCFEPHRGHRKIILHFELPSLVPPSLSRPRIGIPHVDPRPTHLFRSGVFQCAPRLRPTDSCRRS